MLENMLFLQVSEPLSRAALSMWFFWITFAAVFSLVVAVLFGGDDHDMDHDLDHDIGDADHSGGMSFLSFRVLAMFVTGFGAGGFFAAQSDFSVVGSSLWGIGAGLIMALIGFWFLNLFYKSQESHTVRIQDTVGATGVVETTITPSGIGKVSCSIRGRQESFSAKAESTIPVATPIKVVSVAGSLLVVESLQN